jgi:hypothetical protein
VTFGCNSSNAIPKRRDLAEDGAVKRYVAKKEDIPELEHKPGRFWGVVNRKHLPFGKREHREFSAADAVQLRRTIRRYRVANTCPEKRKFLRKSQLWSQEFTAKLFCNVDFWVARVLRSESG